MPTSPSISSSRRRRSITTSPPSGASSASPIEGRCAASPRSSRSKMGMGRGQHRGSQHRLGAHASHHHVTEGAFDAKACCDDPGARSADHPVDCTGCGRRCVGRSDRLVRDRSRGRHAERISRRVADAGRLFEPDPHRTPGRSEEHTSELQSHSDLVCRLLLEKKKKDNPVAIEKKKTTDQRYTREEKETK